MKLYLENKDEERVATFDLTGDGDEITNGGTAISYGGKIYVYADTDGQSFILCTEVAILALDGAGGDHRGQHPIYGREIG